MRSIFHGEGLPHRPDDRPTRLGKGGNPTGWDSERPASFPRGPRLRNLAIRQKLPVIHILRGTELHDFRCNFQFLEHRVGVLSPCPMNLTIPADNQSSHRSSPTTRSALPPSKSTCVDVRLPAAILADFSSASTYMLSTSTVILLYCRYSCQVADPTILVSWFVLQKRLASSAA